MTDRPSFTNQQINTIVPNGKADPSFLYYSLRTRKQELLSLGAATGVRTPILNKSAFCDLEVELPSLLIQQRIAAVLSAYDDLIENNECRINVLESMARAHYRDALCSNTGAVKNKPVLDPVYWRFVTENVARYVGTKRYYATADIDRLSVVGPGIDYTFADKPSRAQKQPVPYSIWFARMKETYKIAWYGAANEEQTSHLILSSGFAGFEANDPLLWPLLFLTVSSKEFHVQKDLYCTGATQMALTNEGLARIEMPLPSEKIAFDLGRRTAPMLNAMLTLQQSNDVLRRSRDLLLPGLLSGQVELKAEPA